MKSDDPKIETKETPPELSRQEQQQEYDRLYQEQMRRLSCPGCGDTEVS